MRVGIREKACTTLVLVGQAPGKHPKYAPPLALFPLPERSTGAALCDKMGLMRGDYIALERHNVLDFYPGKATSGVGDHFPRGMAKEAAARLIREYNLYGRHILLIGASTALSFGFGKEHAPFTWYSSKPFAMAFVPHLSGVNRWWNDPENNETGSQWLYETGQAWLQTRPNFHPPETHKVVLNI